MPTYPPEPIVKDEYGGEGYMTPDGWVTQDNGTMPENVEKLAEYVVGHRIVAVSAKPEYVEGGPWGGTTATLITLDNGVRVALADTSDCCARTELEAFLLNVDKVDHIITGVGTTDGFTKWHIYADAGDVLELTVNWSPGNAFYYGYGFDIFVVPTTEQEEP